MRDRAYPMWQENRITGVVHDVTEERRLEQEARHAQRLEAVGTLASGIAHDFNNLLMGLAGLAKQALRALPADHPAAALVQRSLESTERGGALTRQLMMFSGQRRAQARPVELDAACRAARELLDRLVGEHIHLTMETGAPGLGVMAEPGEIEQILLNLVTNSRDAMPGGGELGVADPGRGLVGHALGERHRHRHVRRDQGADLRAVLHHQGRGPGDRARALDGIRGGATARRRSSRRFRARPRHGR